MNCALELFFDVCLQHDFTDQDGKKFTTECTIIDGKRRYKNPCIEELVGAVLDSDLTEERGEALSLIVPSFLHRGLLPEPSETTSTEA
jgi:hypothetical protein